MSFEKLGRRIYEETLNQAGQRIFKTKKRNVEKFLNSVDCLHIYAARVASSNNCLNEFVKLRHSLVLCENFTKCKHYYVDSVSDSFVELKDIFDFINKPVIIETSTSEGNMLYYIGPASNMLIDGKHKVRIIIYAYDSRLLDRADSSKDTCAPSVVAYVCDGDKVILARNTDTYNIDRTMSTKTVDIVLKKVGGCKYYYALPKLRNKNIECPYRYFRELISIALLSCNKIYECINSVTMPKTSSRTNSSGKPHTASEPCIVEEDRLVPLRPVYKPSGRSVYKGGHHKSPSPHERRGHYRKCNKGSYNLVDNEYVYVGKGLGSYTWVRSSYVNSASKRLVTYEVK